MSDALIHLRNGPVVLTRGVEAYQLGDDRFRFVGVEGGDLIEIRGPHASMLVSVEFANELADGLKTLAQGATASRKDLELRLEPHGLRLVKA